VEHAVAIQGVTKTFGPKVAVRDLNLAVPAGSLCGFIGPNGAGKTTTIRMVMSILFPDRGEIEVLGRRSAVESKDLIGYLPEERGVYRKMKVGAFLSYVARIKGVDSAGLTEKIKDWLERVGLEDCYRKKCEELSKGMQQKVQFLACVIHDPDLLILDEPFSGLDPVNMRLLRDLIQEQHQAGKTVIFSTHVMHQAETLCQRIFMIHDGRKVLDSTMDEIRSQYDPKAILVETVNGDVDALAGLAGVRAVSRVEGAHLLSLADGAEASAVMREVIERAPVLRVERKRPTLEDVFIEIVSGEAAEHDEASLRAALREGGEAFEAEEVA